MARQGTQTNPIAIRQCRYGNKETIKSTKDAQDREKNEERKMNRENNKLHVCRCGAWTLSKPKSGLSSGVWRIHFPLISQIRFDVVFYQIYTLYTCVETTQKKNKWSKCRCMWRSEFLWHAIFSDNFSFADTLLWQVITKIDWVKKNCQRSVSEGRKICQKTC